jgi:hypothetical protein
MLTRASVVVLLALIGASGVLSTPLPDFRAPKPNLPDLSVTYIERNPQYEGTQIKWDEIDEGPNGSKGNPANSKVANPASKKWPAPGEEVTFTAHVRNKGPVVSAEYDWHWLFDGKEMKHGISPGLKPNEEATYDLKWKWDNGDHWVSFEVDRPRLIDEISKKNNFVVDQTTALAFHFYVQQSLYNWFENVKSGLGSYGWEDWAQFQVREMNRTFRDDIYPSSPDGIKVRVRLDRIVILPDSYKDPGETHAPESNGTGTADGVWGFTNGLLEKDKESSKSFYERKPEWLFGPEWPLFHELGHQLGQPDYYLLPINADRNKVAPGVGYWPPHGYEDTMMFSGNWSHDANLGQDKVKWDSAYRFWGEHAAAALNRDLYVRRGFFGNFLVDIPAKQSFKIVDESGKPLPGAKVELFRSFSREYGNGSIPEKPALAGSTDSKGIWMLTRRPYGFISNWTANGTLFFRVTSDGKERYGWMNITDFNLEYWRGHKDVGEYTLQVKPKQQK